MKRILGLLTILVIALCLAGCTAPINLPFQPTPTQTPEIVYDDVTPTPGEDQVLFEVTTQVISLTQEDNETHKGGEAWVLLEITTQVISLTREDCVLSLNATATNVGDIDAEVETDIRVLYDGVLFNEDGEDSEQSEQRFYFGIVKVGSSLSEDIIIKEQISPEFAREFDFNKIMVEVTEIRINGEPMPFEIPSSAYSPYPAVSPLPSGT